MTVGASRETADGEFDALAVLAELLYGRDLSATHQRVYNAVADSVTEGATTEREIHAPTH